MLCTVAENQSKLFKTAFDWNLWGNENYISYLLTNLNHLERRISTYLEAIRIDFPQLTDHSIIHSRMLWRYADLVVGESNEDLLNPMEAYILHAVFLIHDAAMCCTVLGNKKELETEPLFKDYVSRFGEADDVLRDALFFVVRFFHGDNAFKVATERIEDGDFLISDVNLREEFSTFIGIISKSHSKNISFIERELPREYISPSSVDWKVNCQRLALILRVCDAAHMDNLRTPKSFRDISLIEGVSGEHWKFQKKMGFPTRAKDLLAYVSSTPFSKDDQRAWWLCFNTLKDLDAELVAAYEYCKMHGIRPFAVRGVLSIENPLNLGENYIRTVGWQSIDTRVRVTKPIHLAREIGGIKLYQERYFAVRELLQNSVDAINLYRYISHQERDNTVGKITVSLEKIESEYFMSISDNGIGMGETVLSNELLDFGGSYWKSNSFFESYAGITSRGFKSIGQFGIGFFSVFMLGQQITVTSWKYGDGISNARTLEFLHGLDAQPLLRNPSSVEMSSIIGRGTVIKIRLDEDPLGKDGFLFGFKDSPQPFFSLVSFLAPFTNVVIVVKEQNFPDKTVCPVDPGSLDFSEYLDRVLLSQIKDSAQTSSIEEIKRLGPQFCEISEGKDVYGKLAILPNGNKTIFNGIVVCNGLRVNQLHGLFGYLQVDTITAVKRDSFLKNVPFTALKKWGLQQIDFIEQQNLIPIFFQVYFGLKVAFDEITASTAIALSKTNGEYRLITIQILREFLKSNVEFEIVQENLLGRKGTPTVDGFVHFGQQLPYEVLLRDEDVSLRNMSQVIEELLVQEWGQYIVTETNFFALETDNDFVNVKIYQKS